MNAEMRQALDTLDALKAYGVVIPRKSRGALIVALLTGCYNGCSLRDDLADIPIMPILHTIIAKGGAACPCFWTLGYLAIHLAQQP